MSLSWYGKISGQPKPAQPQLERLKIIVNENCCITLHTLTKTHFSIDFVSFINFERTAKEYSGVFEIDIVSKDEKTFYEIMKNFFVRNPCNNGVYSIRVLYKPHADAASILWEVMIDGIVMKSFELAVPRVETFLEKQTKKQIEEITRRHETRSEQIQQRHETHIEQIHQRSTCDKENHEKAKKHIENLEQQTESVRYEKLNLERKLKKMAYMTPEIYDIGSLFEMNT